MSAREEPPQDPFSDEGLLDSDDEDTVTKTTTPAGDLELDYDELMDNEIPEETVTVAVHASADDVEEGEVTSDEEGEIKESEDEASNTKTHQSPRRTTSANGNDKKDNTQSNDDATDKISRIGSKSVRDKSGSQYKGSSSDGRDSSDERSGAPRGQRRGNQGTVPCRHFMGGKCNWGDTCRFLHEKPDRARPPHERGPDWWEPRDFPPMPPYMPGPGMMGPPRPPMEPRMPFPPPGPGFMPSMHPYPLPPRDIRPPPFDRPARGMDGRKKGKFSDNRTEVREETEGWMRLRTITHEWSSDEEQGKLQSEDLRHKIKKKRDSDSEKHSRAPDEWNDPWARDMKKTNKKKKKVQSSDDSSDSDSEKKTKKKKKKSKAKKSSSDDSSDSEAEKKRKAKKRKKKARDSSDEEEFRAMKKYHSLDSPMPHPFDPRHDPRHNPRRFDPRDEFFPPPHFPPPMIPDHRHPWPPPFESPARPVPKKDQFGRDISKRIEYEDLKKHRRQVEEERHRRGAARRHSSDFSRSPTPPARPESSSEEERVVKPKKHKKSKGSDTDKRVSRKEKLIQELEAINKVIEKKKKAKKHSY